MCQESGMAWLASLLGASRAAIRLLSTLCSCWRWGSWSSSRGCGRGTQALVSYCLWLLVPPTVPHRSTLTGLCFPSGLQEYLSAFCPHRRTLDSFEGLMWLGWSHSVCLLSLSLLRVSWVVILNILAKSFLLWKVRSSGQWYCIFARWGWFGVIFEFWVPRWLKFFFLIMKLRAMVN